MSGQLIRFDWAIKRLLRSKANFGILEGFLSELLNKDIKINNILESEGNKEYENNKFNRLDILVEDEKKELILIEFQVNREADFLSRILYGTSKVITEYAKEGEKYSAIRKVYSVNVLFFNLGEGKDYVYHGTTNFKGIHFKDELKLNNNQKNVYKKELVSEVYPEYFIIKVDQFDDIAKNTLDEWIYFLKNEEVKDSFTAKGLMEAKEKLNRMKLTKEEQVIYNRYLENLKYEESMVETGKVEGKVEAFIEAAKTLKSLNVDIDKIIKATGLTLDEIKKL